MSSYLGDIESLAGCVSSSPSPAASARLSQDHRRSEDVITPSHRDSQCPKAMENASERAVVVKATAALNSLLGMGHEESLLAGSEGTVTTVLDSVEASDTPIAFDLSSTQAIRNQLHQSSKLASVGPFGGASVESDTHESEEPESLPMLPGRQTRASSVVTTQSSTVVTTLQSPPRRGYRQIRGSSISAAVIPALANQACIANNTYDMELVQSERSTARQKKRKVDSEISPTHQPLSTGQGDLLWSPSRPRLLKTAPERRLFTPSLQ